MQTQHLHIALMGNPNSGKSSLFNELTGLRQKVGNFPGVTVDKKTGRCPLQDGLSATLIDLPGSYSLYPRREDEWVSYKILMDQDPAIRPDLILLVVDASNLKRNLLFVSQVIDLKIPVLIALTMQDIARQKNIVIDVPGLARELGVPIISINPRKGKGMEELKRAIAGFAYERHKIAARDFFKLEAPTLEAVKKVQQLLPDLSAYKALHYLINHSSFTLDTPKRDQLLLIEREASFNATKAQAEEILQRYQRINSLLKQTVAEPSPMHTKFLSDRIDDVLLHRTWGYLILLAVLFLLFQSVFWLAEFPMNGIEWLFAKAGALSATHLPPSWFSDLLINGLLAGLSGIVVFVPQIMILFGLITILEDTGYMARISFLSDKLMRKTGLNGKSVMPMISGFACAVPAIMSARNIENKKERLLTILITPLMSCSARLPVFSILIALVIPQQLLFGFLSLRGLVMMGLYVLGVVAALCVAWIAKAFIRIKEKSFFILELPVYRSPRWKNVAVTMVNKAKIFVWDAGKIIMVISLGLWALSSFGPRGNREAIESHYAQQILAHPEQAKDLRKEKSTALLQESYAGYLGRAIEPLITPLGYDWKIGIALITSFAAREVFVGTMATLYSVEGGNDADPQTLTEKMKKAVRKDGTPLYDLPTGLSLLIFYLLAMQCMSTLAVVKRETKTWKWPVVQFVYMTGLAYLSSLLVYQVLK